MILADIKEDRIYFDAPPTWNEELVKIPGARYDKDARQFHAPLSWASCMAARGILGDALDITDELDEWGSGHRQWMAGVEEAKALTFCGRLRPYQAGGAAFLHTAGRALLGDAMRLGKTFQALSALERSPATLPALVICPAGVARVWADEVAKWTTFTHVLVAGTKAQQLKAIESGADIAIVSWSLAAKLSRLAPYGSTKLSDEEKREGPLNGVKWQTIILDEAHRMSDPTTKQTRAAWTLERRARYAWALTGTAMTDNPAGLWPIMHGLAPHEYPTSTGFIDRYCKVKEHFHGGIEITGLEPATRDEFFAFFDSRFLRRTKADVLDQLPPEPQRTTRWVEMGAGQAKAYRQMEKHMLAALEDGVLTALDPLTQRTRLLQLAAATPVLEGYTNERGDPDIRVSALKTPSCKVDALLEIVDEADGAQLVVFAESRKLIELCAGALRKAKVGHVLVTGAVDSVTRSHNVEMFQAGTVQVILLTIGAGSEGIDLAAADTTVFLQRSYEQWKNEQADERTFSMADPSRPRSFIDVQTLDTAEERVHAIGDEKTARAQEIYRDPAQWMREALGA